MGSSLALVLLCATQICCLPLWWQPEKVSQAVKGQQPHSGQECEGKTNIVMLVKK